MIGLEIFKYRHDLTRIRILGSQTVSAADDDCRSIRFSVENALNIEIKRLPGSARFFRPVENG